MPNTTTVEFQAPLEAEAKKARIPPKQIRQTGLAQQKSFKQENKADHFNELDRRKWQLASTEKFRKGNFLTFQLHQNRARNQDSIARKKTTITDKRPKATITDGSRSPTTFYHAPVRY